MTALNPAALLCVLALPSCGTTIPSQSGFEADASAQAHQRLGNSPDLRLQRTLDLDQDGVHELLIADEGSCGSGGCSWMLFAARGQRAQYLGQVAGRDPRELGTSTQGWRDFAIQSHAGYTDYHEYEEAFDGTEYTTRRVRWCERSATELVGSTCGPWSASPSSDQRAREFLGLPDDGAPFGCNTRPVTLGTQEAEVLVCEGMNTPDAHILLHADGHISALGASHPGVEVGFTARDLTGDGVAELLHTGGGGGTLYHALTLRIHRWNGERPVDIGSVDLQLTPILVGASLGPTVAQVVTGTPLCVRPATPSKELYEVPTVALDDGHTLVYDPGTDRLVPGRACAM